MSNHRLAQHVVTAVVCRQPLRTPEDVRQTVEAVEEVLDRNNAGLVIFCLGAVVGLCFAMMMLSL